jgi:glutaredoxin 3
MACGRNVRGRTVVKASVPRIRMYSTTWCGYCVRAKVLLDSKGLDYEEISLDDDPGFRARVHALTGGWTVPQILIDGEPIGGYTELWRLDRNGALDERLAAESSSQVDGSALRPETSC